MSRTACCLLFGMEEWNLKATFKRAPRRDLKERKIDRLRYYKDAIDCLGIFFVSVAVLLWVLGNV